MNQFEAPICTAEEVETRLNQFHHYGYRIRQVFPAGDKFLIFAEADPKREPIASPADLEKVRIEVEKLYIGSRIDHNVLPGLTREEREVHLALLEKEGLAIVKDGWWWRQ